MSSNLAPFNDMEPLSLFDEVIILSSFATILSLEKISVEVISVLSVIVNLLLLLFWLYLVD